MKKTPAEIWIVIAACIVTMLILLFAHDAAAQNGQTESEIALLQSSRHSYHYIPDSDPVIRLSDLIEYETECYNDSSFVQGYVEYVCHDPGCVVYHGAEWLQYWIHREPTFSGFIQWFKNKVK